MFNSRELAVEALPLYLKLPQSLSQRLTDINGPHVLHDAVPEPSALLLLAGGLIGIAIRKRRR